jgi:hypothetical protein
MLRGVYARIGGSMTTLNPVQFFVLCSVIFIAGDKLFLGALNVLCAVIFLLIDIFEKRKK